MPPTDPDDQLASLIVVKLPSSVSQDCPLDFLSVAHKNSSFSLECCAATVPLTRGARFKCTAVLQERRATPSLSARLPAWLLRRASWRRDSSADACARTVVQYRGGYPAQMETMYHHCGAFCVTGTKTSCVVQGHTPCMSVHTSASAARTVPHGTTRARPPCSRRLLWYAMCSCLEGFAERAWFPQKKRAYHKFPPISEKPYFHSCTIFYPL